MSVQQLWLVTQSNIYSFNIFLFIIKYLGTCCQQCVKCYCFIFGIEGFYSTKSSKVLYYDKGLIDILLQKYSSSMICCFFDII